MKKMLEDAANCIKISCEGCSLREVPKCGTCRFDGRRELIAKAALKCMEILERHFIGEGHYSSAEELTEVKELLRESGSEK